LIFTLLIKPVISEIRPGRIPEIPAGAGLSVRNNRAQAFHFSAYPVRGSTERHHLRWRMFTSGPADDGKGDYAESIQRNTGRPEPENRWS